MEKKMYLTEKVIPLNAPAYCPYCRSRKTIQIRHNKTVDVQDIINEFADIRKQEFIIKIPQTKHICLECGGVFCTVENIDTIELTKKPKIKKDNKKPHKDSHSASKPRTNS